MYFLGPLRYTVPYGYVVASTRATAVRVGTMVVRTGTASTATPTAYRRLQLYVNTAIYKRVEIGQNVIYWQKDRRRRTPRDAYEL